MIRPKPNNHLPYNLPVASECELGLVRGGARHAERNAADTRATASRAQAEKNHLFDTFEGLAEDAAKDLNARLKSRPTVC